MSCGCSAEQNFLLPAMHQRKPTGVKNILIRTKMKKCPALPARRKKLLNYQVKSK